MSIAEAAGVGALSLILGLTALALWAAAFSGWWEARTPPTPHDPARYFELRMFSWEQAPEALQRWQDGGPQPTGGSSGGVEVAEILAVLGGRYSDDGGGVGVRMRLLLPDGSTTEVHTEAKDVRNVRHGMLVPIRTMPEGRSHVLGDTVELAWDLSATGVREILLDHRHRVGLLDDAQYRSLADAAPTQGSLVSIRPTGRIHRGHVEVSALIRSEAGDTVTAQGFLRPEELATARHTGKVLTTEASNGERALWPAWY